MKNNPLVSIIVPVYNTEKYLRKCLDSILGQSYQNLEIILVDDGSTDKSGDIIDEYQKKDGRVVTIHKKNGGQSSARNLGIKNASGEFIGFVDSDDEIAEDFVNKLLFDENEAVLKISNMTRRDSEKSNIIYSGEDKFFSSSRENILRALLEDGKLYPVVNKLFLNNIIKAKELSFNENLNFAEDLDFVLRYLSNEEKEIIFTREPLYIYNFKTESSTMKKVSANKSNWKQSYRDLKNWAGKNLSLKEKSLLRLIKLRWEISYLKAKLGR